MTAVWGLAVLCLGAGRLAAVEPERLTSDGKLKSAPVFAGPGEVVFAVHESPNLVALKRLKIKERVQERLHPALTAHQLDPAFSPDGRYHAFAQSATSPQLILVIQDTKQKAEATFRPLEARAVVRSPTISPDGRRVAFCVSADGGYRIASVNVRGADLKTLTASPGLNMAPAFSPDGKRIAFCSSRNGDLEIYVMDADGGNVRRLTHSPGLDTRPAWSPDGRRIAFTSNRDRDYEVYVMKADGTAVRRVTAHAGKDDYAAWDPAGDKLLIVSEREGKSDLYLVEVGE